MSLSQINCLTLFPSSTLSNPSTFLLENPQEKYILNRILPSLTENAILPTHSPYGFRSTHSTIRQVHRIVNAGNHFCTREKIILHLCFSWYFSGFRQGMARWTLIQNKTIPASSLLSHPQILYFWPLLQHSRRESKKTLQTFKHPFNLQSQPFKTKSCSPRLVWYLV